MPLDRVVQCSSSRIIREIKRAFFLSLGCCRPVAGFLPSKILKPFFLPSLPLFYFQISEQPLCVEKTKCPWVLDKFGQSNVPIHFLSSSSTSVSVQQARTDSSLLVYFGARVHVRHSLYVAIAILPPSLNCQEVRFGLAFSHMM